MRPRRHRHLNRVRPPPTIRIPTPTRRSRWIRPHLSHQIIPPAGTQPHAVQHHNRLRKLVVLQPIHRPSPRIALDRQGRRRRHLNRPPPAARNTPPAPAPAKPSRERHVHRRSRIPRSGIQCPGHHIRPVRPVNVIRIHHPPQRIRTRRSNRQINPRIRTIVRVLVQLHRNHIRPGRKRHRQRHRRVCRLTPAIPTHQRIRIHRHIRRIIIPPRLHPVHINNTPVIRQQPRIPRLRRLSPRHRETRPEQIRVHRVHPAVPRNPSQQIRRIRKRIHPAPLNRQRRRLPPRHRRTRLVKPHRIPRPARPIPRIRVRTPGRRRQQRIEIIPSPRQRKPRTTPSLEIRHQQRIRHRPARHRRVLRGRKRVIHRRRHGIQRNRHSRQQQRKQQGGTHGESGENRCQGKHQSGILHKSGASRQSLQLQNPPQKDPPPP